MRAAEERPVRAAHGDVILRQRISLLRRVLGSAVAGRKAERIAAAPPALVVDRSRVFRNTACLRYRIALNVMSLHSSYGSSPAAWRQCVPSLLRGRMRSLGAQLAILVGLCILPGRAQAFAHTVMPGDTLASIAETFYGRIQHENLLVVANALEAQGGIRIAPGMRLEVPALSYVRTQPADTWKALALELLGGEHRAAALASANGTKPWLPPDPDTEIIVPYNLRYVTTGDETIVGLAYRYLGDRKLAWMLDQYNQRKGRRIQRGEVVLIPITDIRLTAAGKAAAERADQRVRLQSGGDTRELQLRVEKELAQLKADIHQGHYVAAVARANRFLGEGTLTQKQRAISYQRLVTAYVALGTEGLARDACAKWKEAAGQVNLDPLRVSPKIRAACGEPTP